MPVSGWNRRFQGVGNGGWNGAINYGALGTAVAAGYTAASTNTGHDTRDGAFAIGHPEKLADFGWRAVHEMTVTAKAVAAAFYGEGPRYSYWNACSTGGRQGLMEAQRFPEDYNGIIAGAPANPMTRLHAGSLWNTLAVHKDAASFIPAEKYAVLHKAAVEACDATDGVTDGLIGDPPECRFDPGTLLCKGEDSAACLTAPQVEAVRRIYAGAKNPKTGEAVFPGWEPGSELGWPRVTTGAEPEGNAVDTYRAVLQDPAWDWRKFDFARDVAAADKAGAVIDAKDADLTPFFSRGGKLLMFHGWNDPNIAPRNSIAYYQSVLNRIGEERVSGSIRLFMMPGMGHCAGGEGPNTFDKMTVMEQWVEKGQTPQTIVASHSTNGAVDRTRPLCSYPQVARYKGSGSIDDAANFVCASPK